jgi:perosamine synthetase
MSKLKNKKIYQIKPLILSKDIKSVSDYIKSGGWITEKNKNSEFEEKFKNLTKSKYAITFPNGTLTLLGILLTLNLRKNDEVIVPALTMVATANSVILAGAKVIFCDVEEDSLCMSPKSLKSLITKNTRAIIYVTLNGRSGNIFNIKSICRNYNISLVEDSAHSIGSYYKNNIHHGNLGVAASFSFSMPKIITTGQGGMIVTNNYLFYKKIRQLKNFGRFSDGNDDYNTLGYNFKFTDLQSSLGISQLSNIRHRIKKKRDIYKLYIKELASIKEIFFKKFQSGETPWFVDVYLNKKKELAKFLLKNQIFTRYVYPPLNKLDFYKSYSKNSCPVAEKYSSSGLWLPSSLDLSKKDIIHICRLIKIFFRKIN